MHKKKIAVDEGSIAPKFTYVVHDLFSGGSVPSHLFTTQFWDELKAIIHPDGVVAVVSMSIHHGASLRYSFNIIAAELRGLAGHRLVESGFTHPSEELWTMPRLP